ncbi:MAG: SDR family oxidoreductase [Proteobacteria bacterium]|nr:SDR family oxidoreductase [Pseudomonadota bacterium]
MSNKVALVTGGSTGIGAAIAKHLAEEGFKVLITGRNENTLKESAAQHENIDYIVSDVSKPEDVKKTVEHIKSTFGQLDVLVNNAGIAPPVPFEKISLDHYDQVYNVNVRGLVDMTLNSLPLLKESKGNIVNISSVVSDRPIPGFTIYSSTKGAVTNLTMGLAKELAPMEIRVNAVSPGPIETPLFDKTGLTEDEMQHMGEQINSMVPLGRFGTADEVATTVAFLASEKAAYITGAQYKVDGGFGA